MIETIKKIRLWTIIRDVITLWRKRKVIKRLKYYATVFSFPISRATETRENSGLVREGVQRDIFESQLATYTSLFLWKPKKYLSDFQKLHRQNQIHDLVEDCLNNNVEQYIMRHGVPPWEQLFVTREGRDLLEPFLLLGYCEAVFSKYSKTVTFLLGGGIVGASWLLKYILSLISHK